jgi:hypothetical protein
MGAADARERDAVEGRVARRLESHSAALPVRTWHSGGAKPGTVATRSSIQSRICWPFPAASTSPRSWSIQRTVTSPVLMSPDRVGGGPYPGPLGEGVIGPLVIGVLARKPLAGVACVIDPDLHSPRLLRDVIIDRIQSSGRAPNAAQALVAVVSPSRNACPGRCSLSTRMREPRLSAHGPFCMSTTTSSPPLRSDAAKRPASHAGAPRRRRSVISA